MDPTTTITSPTDTSADQENNTPTHTQPIQPSSFTTTVSLKKNQNQRHHNSPPPVHAAVTYKECLRNHAASLGGRALDGCGEFMPSPTAFPSDPTFLKCAACGCHRNFHRRESTGSTTTTTTSHFHLHPPPPHRCSSPSPFPPPPISTNYQHSTHTLLGLSTAVHPEDHKPAANHHHHQQLVATPTTPRPSKAEKPFGRKRFRTKFNQEQKEKMFSFSEKLGWKLHKCDEQEIEEFCTGVGVGKGVLKVWMHNNKHTFGKRSATNNNISSNNISTLSNGRVRFDNNGPNINNSNDENSSSQNMNESNGADFHVSVNGSSSSS